MKLVVMLTVALSLSACATHNEKSESGTSKEIGAAVTAPLSDLNLVKTAIPSALQQHK